MARSKKARRPAASTGQNVAAAGAQAANDTTAQRGMAHEPRASRGWLPGWDALVIAGVVLGFIQILSLAESAALPFRYQDVVGHPFLGRLLPPEGIAAMGEIGPRPGEPIGLLLNAITIGWLILYLVVDAIGRRPDRQPHSQSKVQTAIWGWKWALLSLMIVTLLVGPTVKLMLLREQSGPASYTHDGGVIQTEATIQFLLAGLNPYIEDYVDTPMAEWGFSEYRTALYHYPYLPWTFLFSAPFYLVGQAAGFYDQRVVYLLLFAIALWLVPGLVRSRRAALALVGVLAFNPIMALDVVFGQNDVFVLSWLIFGLAARHRWDRWVWSRSPTPSGRAPKNVFYWLAWVCFGLACASKPTAWFFAPFFGLLMMRHELPSVMSLRGWASAIGRTVVAAWPALLTVGLVVGPYLVWDWYAFYEDVWRWSSGLGETGYQIWGWGASNFVLALGWVDNRFDQWPFTLLQLALMLPLLVWLLHRQHKHNTLAAACWHYGLLLLVFFYGGRFLNENYLGFILAFLAIGGLADNDEHGGWQIGRLQPTAGPGTDGETGEEINGASQPDRNPAPL